MRLGKPALIHSFTSLIGKFSGFLRDIIFASFLGTGVLSDIFILAKLVNKIKIYNLT